MLPLNVRPTDAPNDTGHNDGSISGLENGFGDLKISDPSEPSETDSSDGDDDWKADMKVSMRDPEFRLDTFFSVCCTGSVSKTEYILRAYPDDAFNRRLNHHGQGGAHAAVHATSNNVQMLRLLVNHDFPLDNWDNFDRTPLMDASLLARGEAVDFLLAHNADWRATDANDMNAPDLAEDTDRNRNERLPEAGSDYRALESDMRTREMIARRLRKLMPANPVTTDTHRSRSMFRMLGPDHFAIYRLETHLVLPPYYASKTLGMLDRGSQYSVQAALSGYSQPEFTRVIPNNTWTDKAQALAKFIGHDSLVSYSSHVERQLTAYYVWKHVRVLFDDGAAVFPDDMIWPARLPQLPIVLNQCALCQDCKNFFTRLKKKLRIEPEFVFVTAEIPG